MGVTLHTYEIALDDYIDEVHIFCHAQLNTAHKFPTCVSYEVYLNAMEGTCNNFLRQEITTYMVRADCIIMSQGLVLVCINKL